MSYTGGDISTIKGSLRAAFISSIFGNRCSGSISMAFKMACSVAGETAGLSVEGGGMGFPRLRMGASVGT